ncbi:MAG: Nif3-like dinuclear metal center hexameric protein [Rikenellaceae bacterium]
MTTVSDITDMIEAFAPLSLQASYDNSGLVVGNPAMAVSGVLLAVDVSEAVVEEAIAQGANMIITHHPIIFSPIKRFNSRGYVERSVELAIRHSVALYAAHTNLDSVMGGMSWIVGQRLSLKNMSILEPTAESAGFGVVGELEQPVPTLEYIDFVARELQCRVVRHSEIVAPELSRVAICTGSGGSLMEAVRVSGADIYITGDLKYNDFMSPSGGFTVVDVGHYESEYCANDILYDILSKKMFNFAVRKSEASSNPVCYRGYFGEN